VYSRSVAHAPRIFCRATVPWGGVVPKVSVDAAAGAGRIKVRGATSSDCVANFARSQHRHAASTFCSYLKMPRLRNWLTPSRAQVHDFAPQVCEHMVSGLVVRALCKGFTGYVIKIGFTRVNLKCELAVSCIFSPQEVSKPPSVELPSSLTLRSVALVCEKNSPSSVVSRNRPRPHTVMSHHSTESIYALSAHNLKRRARTHTLAANLVVALGGSP
jgi:hypothetical protein